MSPRPKSKSTKKPVPVSAQNLPQRLQKLLASAGFGSRRQCEELILLGRVEVDGETVTKLGTTVDPQTSKVRVDGVMLKPQKLTYYAVNKPVGIVTTNRDPHGRPRVIDLVPPTERVFPVGRLDRNSEGLILLTNDGDLAQQLTHPKFGVRKIYRVTVAGRVEKATMDKMQQGIYIAEGLVRVDGAKIIKAKSSATDLEIVLREGKNREIRRILARLGHKVQTLKRIAVGPLRLGDTPPGSYRILTREEIQKLRREVALPVGESESEKEESGAAIKSAAKRKSGTKRSDPNKPSAKRPFAKRPASGSTIVKAPGSRRPLPRDKAAKMDFDFGESRTVGVVIGEEGDTTESTKRRGTKKRSSGERSGTKRVAGKSSGNATGAKRGIGKKRSVKKGGKKKPANQPTATPVGRRGEARVKKTRATKKASSKPRKR